MMTSYGVPLKQYNTQSRISLEMLKQCSLNLTQEMNITSQNDAHCAVAMTEVMRLVPFQLKLKSPDFQHNGES